MSRSRTKVALHGVLLLIWSTLAHAENADRDKPIHLESDRVVVDDAKQTSVFDGEVELTQGTIRIQAEKIVVIQDKAGFKHCTATGQLASFRQKQEGTEQYMEGYGERIEYDTRAEVVDFYVQARVRRDQDDVQGDHIEYSTRTEVFKVFGDPAHANDPGKGRVHAVIQPKAEETPDKPAPKNAPLTIQSSPTLSNEKP